MLVTLSQEFIKAVQNIGDAIERAASRTERYAVHPQEPVVQSACNEHAPTEQAAGVVQDGMEPSDRKALSVQSAATFRGVRQQLVIMAAGAAQASVVVEKMGLAPIFEEIETAMEHLMNAALMLPCDREEFCSVRHEAERAAAD